jgi:UDP-glucose-4-epimerase GalE
VALLVTGGAGFVGAHVARAAHDAGQRVVVLDDLSTSPSWPRLPEAIGCVCGDVGDRGLVTKLVTTYNVDAIVHCAGRIRVDESVREPTLYFDQNVAKTATLLDAATFAARREIAFVLSSSAAVYGQPEASPIHESVGARPISPYGASKLAAEVVLAAYGQARGVRWAALRYFNAAGAHPDGSLRERHEPETHLVPLAIDAALGRRPSLVFHGDDYPTRDGSCERDYVHVMDLAEAHLAAILALDRDVAVGTLNLGSGRGSTVREVLDTVEHVTARRVPHKVGPRRVGDPAQLVAATRLAAETINWRPHRTLVEIVSDAHRSRTRD